MMVLLNYNYAVKYLPRAHSGYIGGFKRVYAVVREEDNIVAPVAELTLKDEFVYRSVHFIQEIRYTCIVRPLLSEIQGHGIGSSTQYTYITSNSCMFCTTFET